MKIKIHTFGCRILFLNEKRTKPYLAHGEGVLELKIELWSKTLRGADSSAGWRAERVCGF